MAADEFWTGTRHLEKRVSFQAGLFKIQFHSRLRRNETSGIGVRLDPVTA